MGVWNGSDTHGDPGISGVTITHVDYDHWCCSWKRFSLSLPLPPPLPQHIPVSGAESRAVPLSGLVKHRRIPTWSQQLAFPLASLNTAGPRGQWRVPQPEWRQQHRKPAGCHDAPRHWELARWPGYSFVFSVSHPCLSLVQYLLTLLALKWPKDLCQYSRLFLLAPQHRIFAALDWKTQTTRLCSITTPAPCNNGLLATVWITSDFTSLWNMSGRVTSALEPGHCALWSVGSRLKSECDRGGKALPGWPETEVCNYTQTVFSIDFPEQIPVGRRH